MKAAMASYKESSKTSTVETDEPDPKVPKLTARTSSADETVVVELEDHSTEDLHLLQTDNSTAEEDCSTECLAFKQENWQLKNRLITSKAEIRQLKYKLKTSKDNLESRWKEQKKY